MILRSFQFAPGDSEKKIGKALSGEADAVILDLEDSVAPANKAAARRLAAEALAQARNLPRRPSLWVRINPLDSEHVLPDLSAVVHGAPDGIVLPKCEGPEDISRLSGWLDELEAQAGFEPGRTRLLPLVTETPKAVFAAGSYTGCGPRLWGLTWGAEDLSAALGALSNRDESGGFNFTSRLSRSLCLLGARAAGVEPVETVFTDLRDTAGLEAYARAGRREGFSGMLAVHPDQVPVINAAFTPSSEEIAAALRVVEAFTAQPDAGVVTLDGRMLDRPHLVQAERVLELSDRLANR